MTKDEEETEQYLADTWVLFARAPVVIDGQPVTCPRCAATDNMRVWLYHGQPVVKIQHACIGRHARSGSDFYRRWIEPRVTPEWLRAHGETMLDRVNNPAI